MNKLDAIIRKVEKLEATLKVVASAEVAEIFMQYNNLPPTPKPGYELLRLYELQPGYCRIVVSVKNPGGKIKKLKPVIMKTRHYDIFSRFIYTLFPTGSEAPVICMPVNGRDKIVTGKELIINDTSAEYLKEYLENLKKETEGNDNEECSG